MGLRTSKELNGNFENIFGSLEARVDRINISGLHSTKNDYIYNAVIDLLQIKNTQQMFETVNDVTQKLSSLGCFKNVHVLIDISSKNPYGYVINFTGKEFQRVTGTVGTEIGQNQGILTAELKTPNLFGRGECITLHGDYTNGRTSDISLKFWKPFYHSYKFGVYRPEITLNCFKHINVFPAIHCRSNDWGKIVSFDFQVPKSLKHSVQFETAIRELVVSEKQIPLRIREQSGPKLISALRYIADYDTRDCMIFPTTGFHLKVINELNGLGIGSSTYAMTQSQFEYNHSIVNSISVQFSYRFGLIKSNQKGFQIPISNLFMLGGPLTVRGFETAGIGPHIEGIPIGTKTFWSSGVNIWSPVPFSDYFGRFKNKLKLHLFYNCGNTDNFSLDKHRSAVGLGIAIKIGETGRIELNYCCPLRWQNTTDRIHKGFQYSIGLDYL